MSTVNWPSAHHFEPRDFSVGLRVPKSGFTGFYTLQSTTLSHLADRLQMTLQLRACRPEQGAEREAFINGLVSSGDWVRMGHPSRQVPRGTLRGTPTVAANAAAGARSFTLNGTPGETLLAADMLSVADQLLPVAYAGAVVAGGGTATVPLQLPLRVALTAGQAITWNTPTGLWQLAADQIDLGYMRGHWQQAVSLPFREVFLL
jgi:hypothetical protein